MTGILAVTYDLSLNQLLEKGIAVFFAVFLLVVFGKRLKALEGATNRQTSAFQQAINSQTVMFHDCLVWIAELIRHDKKMSPPTSPGLPKRRVDDSPVTGTPTPMPPMPPFKPTPPDQGDFDA